MKFIQQYKNLSKEIYILFFGRVVTSMGSLIWPLLTLILKNKLGYNATTIATITMAMSILQFPMLLLGGKLALFRVSRIIWQHDHVFRAYYLKRQYESKHYYVIFGYIQKKVTRVIYSVLKKDTTYITNFA